MKGPIGGGILLFMFYRITAIQQLRYEWGFLFFIVIIKFNEELINCNHKGFRLVLKILNSIDFSMND